MQRPAEDGRAPPGPASWSADTADRRDLWSKSCLISVSSLPSGGCRAADGAPIRSGQNVREGELGIMAEAPVQEPYLSSRGTFFPHSHGA